MPGREHCWDAVFQHQWQLGLAAVSVLAVAVEEYEQRARWHKVVLGGRYERTPTSLPSLPVGWAVMPSGKGAGEAAAGEAGADVAVAVAIGVVEAVGAAVGLAVGALLCCGWHCGDNRRRPVRGGRTPARAAHEGNAQSDSPHEALHGCDENAHCPLREYDEHRIFAGVAWVNVRDAAALLEIVHDGALVEGHDPFPPSVLLALAELIPSDACVGYQEADFAGGFRIIELVEVVGMPPSSKTEDAFHTFGWQNPMHCRLHALDEDVLRLSDLLTRRQRMNLEYNELVWRQHGIDDALRVWLPAPAGRARSIYLERSGKNYTVLSEKFGVIAGFRVTGNPFHHRERT